jgi:hypothetical protein
MSGDGFVKRLTKAAGKMVIILDNVSAVTDIRKNVLFHNIMETQTLLNPYYITN